MAFSLRLPDDLDKAARLRADSLGVSLNSLICVSLDYYLASGGPKPGRVAPPLPLYVKPGPVAKPPEPKLSKAERRALTVQKRAFRKAQGSLDLVG